MCYCTRKIYNNIEIWRYRYIDIQLYSNIVICLYSYMFIQSKRTRLLAGAHPILTLATGEPYARYPYNNSQHKPNTISPFINPGINKNFLHIRAFTVLSPSPNLLAYHCNYHSTNRNVYLKLNNVIDGNYLLFNLCIGSSFWHGGQIINLLMQLNTNCSLGKHPHSEFELDITIVKTVFSFSRCSEPQRQSCNFSNFCK